MKAITVRYLAATDTKGARLKAFDMHGLNITQSRSFELSVEDQARAMVNSVLVGWALHSKRTLKITGFGQISRNDTVFTIGYDEEIPVTVSESIRLQKERSNV